MLCSNDEWDEKVQSLNFASTKLRLNAVRCAWFTLDSNRLLTSRRRLWTYIDPNHTRHVSSTWHDAGESLSAFPKPFIRGASLITSTTVICTNVGQNAPVSGNRQSPYVRTVSYGLSDLTWKLRSSRPGNKFPDPNIPVICLLAYHNRQ